MKKVIRTGLIVSLFGLGFSIVGALLAPGYFPVGEQIPVHWGANGEADQFASPEIAKYYLWLMPATLLFITLVMWAAPMLDPFRKNLEQSRKAYGATWVSVVALMTCLQFGIIASMTGRLEGDTIMIRAILAGTGVLFVVLGNYLPKTRPNFFLGIRTPWTLTSSTAWEKTHRLGGPLFMLAGLLGCVSAFMLDGIALALFIPSVVLPMAIGLMIYSYLVWRKADDRISWSDYTA